MIATRRAVGAVALLAALSGIAACGPDDSEEQGAPAGSGASATPSASASGASDSGEDCGKPPKLPVGHTRVKVTLMRDSGGFEAAVAEPHCTPNDWIYGADETDPVKHYVLPEDVEAQLALMDGPGQWKRVGHEELALHIDRCHAQEIGAPTDDYPEVEPPFGCFGNVYEITVGAGGEVRTIKEIWSV
ncbi:hypothetical protein SAMN05216483_1287 [Streptomyces sp. 2131.1]|uniref:hypothetical protein n=1 Tax=Streptomyces sp. 2131.1 TaxID=1855346 RepID=UPI000898AA86|nr:hypothetical protein [Streptomyces sp. 2131.1]SEC21788.1 hypothetical protein SAMN05216483_1287 [Streptomyces sp. 2131.1]